jgi:hypothetical protein
MLVIGLILLVIGILCAVFWHRTAGLVLSIVGAVFALIALLGGGGGLTL